MMMSMISTAPPAAATGTTYTGNAEPSIDGEATATVYHESSIIVVDILTCTFSSIDGRGISSSFIDAYSIIFIYNYIVAPFT